MTIWPLVRSICSRRSNFSPLSARFNWQGPLLLDQFPFREDPIRAAQASIRTIRGMERLLDRLDLGALTAAQGRQDALEAQRIVMDALLGVGIDGGLQMIDTQRGNTEKVERLRKLARSVRRWDLQVVHGAKLGHVGGEMSATDILVTLYFAVLRIDPSRPNDPERDRFILSKGHSAVALYTTLAHAGFFPLEELADVRTAPFAAERASRPQESAGRGDQHRAARPRFAGRRRCGAGSQAPGQQLAGVRAHRRRRTARGQQLGGGHVGRAL